MSEEVPPSGVKAKGCATVSFLRPDQSLFGVGDTLYYAAKARRGVLEKVVIKGTRPVTPRRPTEQKVLYVDTFNGLWNEWDLVWYDEAVVLVTAYRQRLAEERSRLDKC